MFVCSRNYVVIVIVTRCAINNLPTIYAPTGRPRLVIQSGLQVAVTPIQCHPFSQRTNRTEGTRTPTTATAQKMHPKSWMLGMTRAADPASHHTPNAQSQLELHGLNIYMLLLFFCFVFGVQLCCSCSYRALSWLDPAGLLGARSNASGRAFGLVPMLQLQLEFGSGTKNHLLPLERHRAGTNGNPSHGPSYSLSSLPNRRSVQHMAVGIGIGSCQVQVSREGILQGSIKRRNWKHPMTDGARK